MPIVSLLPLLGIFVYVASALRMIVIVLIEVPFQQAGEGDSEYAPVHNGARWILVNLWDSGQSVSMKQALAFTKPFHSSWPAAFVVATS